MFDWASQPFATLLLTFIFGPYFAAIVADSLMASGVDEGAADAHAGRAAVASASQARSASSRCGDRLSRTRTW